MRVIIQIPCLNEERQLPGTLADLPRELAGASSVEWMVIDDGSTDRTIEVARANGVDHIVKLPGNKGLATAFQTGLDAAIKLGADVIVNTDADNQYQGKSIPDLVAPVLSGDAEIVIGDRGVADHPEFSWLKRRLQVLGSQVVSRAAGIDVPDTTSGFRAYSREAALELTVVNPYTYTLESIIQAGRSGQVVSSVPVGTNPATRDSRLFGSTWGYVRRNAAVISRVYAAYVPLFFFGALAFAMALAGLISFSPFMIDWIRTGDRDGHLQSIILGSVLLLASVQIAALAVVADLIRANRSVSQRTLSRVRRLEQAVAVPPPHYLPPTEVESESWQVERRRVQMTRGQSG